MVLGSVLFVFVLMLRRPPISTRTDTPFPYTPLFRSRRGRFGHDLDRTDKAPGVAIGPGRQLLARVAGEAHLGIRLAALVQGLHGAVDQLLQFFGVERLQHVHARPRQQSRVYLERGDLGGGANTREQRSEERPVGIESGRTWRSRWSPPHYIPTPKHYNR